MRKPLFAALLLAISSAFASAQPDAVQATIHTLAGGKGWIINAGQSSYAISVNEHKMLQSIYWGGLLPDWGSVGPDNPPFAPTKSSPERASFDPSIATTPLEYPAWGAGLFTEPALKVDSPNGDRTLILEYQSARIENNILDITLRDKSQPVVVHLYYQPFQEGVLARWSRIENHGMAPIQIEQAASATYNLPPATDYRLSWLTGQWGGEWQFHSAPLQNGMQVLESRRGSTGHQANPWFSIGKTNKTTENAGPVWFGELGWSGSWRITLESTALNKVRITGGYNPYDFRYPLAPGASLETPRFYAGFTNKGEGEASRILHRFQLGQILPTHATYPRPRPIIYNSWEATGFDVTETGQFALAERAAKLGVERFVIDDGWFGQRKDDHAGLGDWYVNPQKFPHGLKPVIDKVHSLGMDFGIWVEPEMINPDSDLYRKHPEWAMQMPGRQHTEQRNQLMLNLAREDVKEYVFQWLDELVSKNDIAFLKWDYNRNWSEPGWNTAPGSSAEHPNPDAEKQIYVQFVNNVYEILSRLRQKHPKLEIDSCSGGGGRVDLGILRYTDEVWPSDNTDALDRLNIQYGFTHAYSPETMVAWVTDVPNFNGRTTPLDFRFLVAMQGALGIGNNLNKFTDTDMATATRLIAYYKTIRETVQHGNLYRLASPLEGEASQMEYVAQDGSNAVVLAYLHSQHYGIDYPPVILQGLEPTGVYKIVPLDPKKYTGPEKASGAWLMNAGLPIKLTGDYDATAIRLEKQ